MIKHLIISSSNSTGSAKYLYFFRKCFKEKLLNIFSNISVLLKPNVAKFNFCEQKFVQHGPITIAIDCNNHSLLVSKEKLPNYISGPKSALNSASFWVCRLFNVCVRVFCVPNAIILHLYMPAKIKRSSICIFCKSIAGPLSGVYTHIRSAEG